jgi:membrane-bound metal-dependent hydrolase YbcI (DUF457 family)
VFIGHIGVAMAAKRAAPKTSLGTLIMAAQFVDLIWPIFLLAGIERVAIVPGNTAVTPLAFTSYPFSHSLLADLGWATLFAGIYKLVNPRSGGAFWLWLLVMSHWVLDALTHRPDLPLYPGSSTYVGLGLWYSRPGTILVEGAIFAVGVALYLRATRPRDRLGIFTFWAFVGTLVGLYFGNLYGPPPPSVKALGVVGLSAWLLVAWGYWIDRHRVPTFGT